MGRLGGKALETVIVKLSPHLHRATAMLAIIPVFEPERIGLEPEERLAVYVKLIAMRKKMGLPLPEHDDNGIFEEKTERDDYERTALG